MPWCPGHTAGEEQLGLLALPLAPSALETSPPPEPALHSSGDASMNGQKTNLIISQPRAAVCNCPDLDFNYSDCFLSWTRQEHSQKMLHVLPLSEPAHASGPWTCLLRGCNWVLIHTLPLGHA